MSIHILFSCNDFLCPGNGNADKTIQGEFTRGQVITLPPRHLAFSSSCFCKECHQNHQLWYSLNIFFFFFFFYCMLLKYFSFFVTKACRRTRKVEMLLGQLFFCLIFYAAISKYTWHFLACFFVVTFFCFVPLPLKDLIKTN